MKHFQHSVIIFFTITQTLAYFVGRMGEDVIDLLKAQQICVLLSSVPVEGVPEINEMQMVLGQVGRMQLHFFKHSFQLHSHLRSLFLIGRGLFRMNPFLTNGD